MSKRGCRAVAIVFACVPAALVVAWKLFEAWHFAGVVPVAIGIDYPIAIDGISDFREGCGMAVFRIDAATKRDIRSGGLAFFKHAGHSRKANDAYHTFSSWHSTPDPAWADDDQTLLSPGLECAKLDGGLRAQLENAARTAGAYYAYGPEKALLVVPELGIVALSYNG